MGVQKDRIIISIFKWANGIWCGQYEAMWRYEVIKLTPTHTVVQLCCIIYSTSFVPARMAHDFQENATDTHDRFYKDHVTKE